MGADSAFLHVAHNAAGLYRVDRPENSPQRRMTSAHWHDALELNYVRRGYGEYRIGGRVYPIAPDCVFVIPPGVSHRTEPAPRLPHWNLTLYFRPEALAPLGSRAVEHALAIAGEVRHIHGSGLSDLWENLFAGLDCERRHSEATAPLSACAKMLDACLLVSRSVDAAPSGAGGAPPSAQAQYARGMMQYVDAHLGEPLTLRAVARAVGLHPHYACELFRQQCGLQLFAYIATRRAARARSLLCATSLPLAEVAHRCGFRSLPTFYRTMRSVYGQTPAGLRRGGPAAVVNP